MANTAIIGAQWGDEGKGKIVDFLAQQHDIVVRYAGGANAGHTVKVDDTEYVLHLIPCGAIHGKINVIGNGVVVNLDRLREEMEMLERQDIHIRPQNLKISDRAHIITPYHLLMDLANEIHKSRQRDGAIGTTLQGIGPAYELKMSRTSLRTIDLAAASDNELEDRVNALANLVESRVNALEIGVGEINDTVNPKEETRASKMLSGLRPYLGGLLAYINTHVVLEALIQHRERFAPFITDISEFLSQKREAREEFEPSADKKNILFEGAQGTFLDIDHGTYPHVTSSNCTIGGVYTGTGTHLHIQNIIGIVKAYTTRVGNGAFPTELTDETGKKLQEKGNEFGATTGRPRRCGWLDAVMLQHAKRVNGFTELALTKLDVLDGLKEINVCTAYEIDGRRTTQFPASQQELARAKPIYETIQGWQEDTSGVKRFEDLPENAQNYVKQIESVTGTPVRLIGIGKRRDQVIVR